VSRQTRAPAQTYLLPAAWETAVNGWVGWLRAGGKSPTTIDLRRSQVRFIARTTRTKHPRDVTEDQLVQLCGAQRWSNEHRRGTRTSLISFFNYCMRNQVVEVNPAVGLPVVPNDKPRPRPAPEKVWHDLLASAPPRELLMIRLAGEAGLRRAEVAQLRRNDLMEDPRGCCLIVHGKGNKQRIVPVSDSLADAIRGYCEQGYLFPNWHGGQLKPGTVGVLIAEMMPKGYTMHTLRARFATMAYRGSRNIRAVQMLLGHASVATTERYTAVDDDEIRAAMMAAG
jgi:integrase